MTASAWVVNKDRSKVLMAYHNIYNSNSGVAWFTPEEALEKSTEPWFVKHIYSKLIKKVENRSSYEKTGNL